MYERFLEGESFLVICSFSRFPVKAHKPKKFAGKRGKLVLCNYPDLTGAGTKEDQLTNSGIIGNIQQEFNELELKKGYLRPYETRIYRYTF